MTRLPTDVRQDAIKDRPDLPEYRLNIECAVPDCKQIDVENHHIFPRSFQTKSYWVELHDGIVVPNRVGICMYHHEALTDNKARLILQETLYGSEYWWSDGMGLVGALDPHPPKHPGATGNGEARAMGGAGHGPVAPGETCPSCKRRVPHPKQKTSPLTKTVSYRVPIDDAETFHETLEAAAENLGLREKKHWAYWTLVHALVLALQEPKQGDSVQLSKRR